MNIEGCDLSSDLLHAGSDTGGKSSTNTTTISGETKTDSLADVSDFRQHLGKCFVHSGLERGVEFVERAIDTNVATIGVNTAMLDDSSNGGSGQASSTLADKLANLLDETSFSGGDIVQVEVGIQDFLCVFIVGRVIRLNVGHEGGLKRPVSGDLLGPGKRGVLVTLEQELTINHIGQHVTSDLTEIHAGNHLFVELSVRVDGLAIQFVIETGQGENLALIVKGTKLHVDDHFVSSGLGTLPLGDLVKLFNVGTVGTGTQDETGQCSRLVVCVGQECADSIVDKRRDLDGDMLSQEGILQQQNRVLTDSTGTGETLSPGGKNTTIDLILIRGVNTN